MSIFHYVLFAGICWGRSLEDGTLQLSKRQWRKTIQGTSSGHEGLLLVFTLGARMFSHVLALFVAFLVHKAHCKCPSIALNDNHIISYHYFI